MKKEDRCNSCRFLVCSSVLGLCCQRRRRGGLLHKTCSLRVHADTLPSLVKHAAHQVRLRRGQGREEQKGFVELHRQGTTEKECELLQNLIALVSFAIANCAEALIATT